MRATRPHHLTDVEDRCCRVEPQTLAEPTLVPQPRLTHLPTRRGLPFADTCRVASSTLSKDQSSTPTGALALGL